MAEPTHLQRLYPRGNQITYHPHLGTFLWVGWKEARSRPGLIDVLDDCQLYVQTHECYSCLHQVQCQDKAGEEFRDSLTDRG